MFLSMLFVASMTIIGVKLFRGRKEKATYIPAAPPSPLISTTRLLDGLDDTK